MLPVGDFSRSSSRSRSPTMNGGKTPPAASIAWEPQKPESRVPPRGMFRPVIVETQIIDEDREKSPTGSIYSLVPAKAGVQRAAAWNSMDIESRNANIRVRINGQVVAEGPGEAARRKTGPIGLQLHDRFSTVMFRHIRIRETVH